MKNSFEKKPLYRFFNVIFFIMYFFFFLVIVLAAYIGFSERKVISATLNCVDGTSWDATKIYSDNSALCGLCNKRTSDGKYEYCAYKDIDYSTFEVTDKEYKFSNNIMASFYI